MKKVVVSGATGFIGKRISDALLARGDAVTVLTRGAGGTRESETGRRVTLEHWDPTGDAPLGSLGDADAVVHLAGERDVGVRWTAALKREILESRVKSTERLVAAMERASRRPAVFVCASGVGYYGAHEDEPIDERGAAGKDFLAEVTVAWEAAAMKAEAFGVRVVRLRFGAVLGRGGGALAEMVKPFKLFVGGPIGSGRQVVSWVHLDDAAGAALQAIDNDALRGAVNVTAPHAVTNRELSTLIGKALKRPSAMTVPEFALRIRLGEGADPIVTGQRAVPGELERVGYVFRYPEVEGALGESLGLVSFRALG